MDLLVQLTTRDVGRIRKKLVKVAKEEHMKNVTSVWEACL